MSIPDVALTINNSQRLPCVLLLDGSSSMKGKPIESLNQGLRVLEEELKKDDLAMQGVQILGDLLKSLKSFRNLNPQNQMIIIVVGMTDQK